ncbi:ORF060L [Infectious spleen and kidney necrosis virus]|uniref:ORF060L n=1 Tax=Infectious spleen and kidney necrosis virus (isolate Mandarin fish/China/Nanhai/1998) TaxID=654923 RepID=Q8QUQ0_ISKNN|nr:ORF060L [Infectious spleen and kidney necrosis virus]AAL98784.1 ORF060L [Infectious spleen and kidney necrosis virus]
MYSTAVTTAQQQCVRTLPVPLVACAPNTITASETISSHLHRTRIIRMTRMITST